jgi:hypothetical protein
MISRFRKIVVFFVVVLFCALAAWATTPRLIQVTLGTGATQIVVTSTYFNQMTIQNNATHNIRYGDSTVSSTKGILLTPGGAGSTGTVSGQQGDASQFYIAGTSGDVIDVLVW